MVLPKNNHASEQIRAPKDGTIFGASHRLSRCGFPLRSHPVAIEVEFLRNQSIAAGFFVDQRA